MSLVFAHRARSWIVAAGVICLAAACQRRPEHVYDLVEKFPLAELLPETVEIDFGAPESKSFTLAGWSHRENVGETSFMWGLGDDSAVRWFVTEPRPLTLRFRAWAMPDPLPAPLEVQWVVNGRPVQTVAVPRSIGDREVSIPTDALVSGWNRFDFRYSHHRKTNGRRDSRPLAVAWDWLRVTPFATRTQPEVATSNDPPSLTLSEGARLDYYLTLGPDTRFVVDDIVASDSRQGTGSHPALEVELQVAGSPAKTMTLRPGDTESVLDAASSGGSARMARVSLRATSGGGGPGPGAKLTLVHPRLHSASPVGLLRDTRPSPDTLRPVASPPNVIVYLIDTLRADHLGCYGYAKPTTPHIDAFAKDAVRFTHAVAQSSWTRASVASIFTGLRPQAHGVNDREDALSADALTLAEILHEHGYSTAGLVTNGNVDPSLGFGQGFDRYKLYGGGGAENALPSDELNRHISSWLTKHGKEHPFFLYVHTIDPHGPYTPPDAYRRKFASGALDPAIGSLQMLKEIGGFRLIPDQRLKEQLISLYDAEIAFNDASFGDFVQELQRRDLYDSALIILVSDHGEEFGDHGWWEHGRTLYEEQLHVPLLIKFPGGWGAGRQSAITAQHVDLLPTILAQAGIRAPEGLQGSNLTSRIDDPAVERVDAISYLKLDGNELDSIRHDGQKLVRNHQQSYGKPRPARELYALAQDPSEQRNLIDESPVLAGYLRALIVDETSDRRASLQPAKAVLTEDVKEHLRALGYDQ